MSFETITKTDRNNFVVAHLVAGKSLKEVQQLLVEANYPKVDTTRIWKIWKRSTEYQARRTSLRFCSICLENKAVKEMNMVSKNYRAIGRICSDCWDKVKQEAVKEE